MWPVSSTRCQGVKGQSWRHHLFRTHGIPVLKLACVLSLGRNLSKQLFPRPRTKTRGESPKRFIWERTETRAQRQISEAAESINTSDVFAFNWSQESFLDNIWRPSSILECFAWREDSKTCRSATFKYLHYIQKVSASVLRCCAASPWPKGSPRGLLPSPPSRSYRQGPLFSVREEVLTARLYNLLSPCLCFAHALTETPVRWLHPSFTKASPPPPSLSLSLRQHASRFPLAALSGCQSLQ